MEFEASLDYGIPINDKASAGLGLWGGADFNQAKDGFSFNEWNVNASASYQLTGKVKTAGEFGIDGKVEPSSFTPYLLWTIDYSF
jgi:hypothetical protein